MKLDAVNLGEEWQTVLITGGNAGLGEQAARHLVRAGWTVVLACRNLGAGEAAAERMRAETSGAQVEVLPLDLADLDSVKRLVQEWPRLAGNWPPLRAVIANAGLQYPHPHARTAQGFEATFGVNHIGHAALISGLRPVVAAPARVVFVGSGTHDPAQSGGYPAPYDASARALAYPDRYAQAPDPEWRAGMRRYAASKLSNAQTAFFLARQWRARGITVNVFDPGLMPGTGLSRSFGGPLRWLWARVLPALAWLRPDFASTPGRSGAHLAQLVTEPEYAEVTGTYFEQGGRQPGPKVGRASALAGDAAKARRLWEDTLTLLGEVGWPASIASEVKSAV